MYTRTPAWHRWATLMVVVVFVPIPVAAQRLALGAHLVAATAGPFDAVDVGVGGRVSWRVLPVLDVEGEVDLYPGEFPGTPAVSRRRIEVYGGVTAGPRLGRVRPFARVRPGLVVWGQAPGPFACIAIYPPPLACVMARGQTTAAVDLGGGIEVAMTPRTIVRVDAGDRLVRYPGPSLDRRRRRDGPFFGHQFRLAVGAGVRF